MGFKTNEDKKTKNRIYCKFPDTRDSALKALGKTENPSFVTWDGEKDVPVGYLVEGTLVEVEGESRESYDKYVASIRFHIDIGTELVVLQGNINNTVRQILLKLDQADKIEKVSIGLYKAEFADKLYVNTGVIVDGVNIPKVKIDYEAEVAKGTIIEEKNAKGKSKYYYDNPMGDEQEELLFDPKMFDGILLKSVQSKIVGVSEETNSTEVKEEEPIKTKKPKRVEEDFDDPF